MGHDWIIDVLADMRRFASQNDMPLLRAQLDDAMTVATAEVANKHGAATPTLDDSFGATALRPLD